VALGGLTITAMILGFFSTQGLLPDFWNAAFLYNFFYANTPIQDKLNELILGFKELSAAGLLEIGAMGWVLCLILAATKKTKLTFLPLVVVALIDFPLELLLASISGRNFPHYYLTLLPVLCFLTGVVYWALSQSFAGSKIYPYRIWIFSLVTLVLLATQATGYMGTWGYFKEYGSRPRYLNTLAYIKNHPILNGCDDVLVWGNEAIINFLTQKKSPDRYVYQYPLYMPGYTNEQTIMDFINDVIERKPCYIINSKNPYTPFLSFPVESAKIRSGVRTIESMYELDKEFGGFSIYRYNGN
jgi:hypothetical protein